MYVEGAPFEENLAILAVILMSKHGNEVVVTQQEIHDARCLLAEKDVQMVAWDTDRLILPDRVAIAFRYKSRAVLAGEVV